MDEAKKKQLSEMFATIVTLMVFVAILAPFVWLLRHLWGWALG